MHTTPTIYLVINYTNMSVGSYEKFYYNIWVFCKTQTQYICALHQRMVCNYYVWESLVHQALAIIGKLTKFIRVETTRSN